MLHHTYTTSLILLRALLLHATADWDAVINRSQDIDVQCLVNRDCFPDDIQISGLSLLQHRVQAVRRASSFEQQWERAMVSVEAQSTQKMASASQTTMRVIRNGVANTLAVYSSCGISHPAFIGVSVTIFVLLFFVVTTAWFTRPERTLKQSDPVASICEDPQATPGTLQWYHLIIVIGISLMDNFSTDFYVPNMPAIAKELGTNSFMIGLSLQINLCMRGISSLALGLLSDSIGRVRCVILATATYTVATTLAMFSTSITWFLFARAMQGAAEGVVFVCDAIIRDAFPDARRRMKTLALMGTLAPLAVVGAPMVGGILGSTFGWRVVFGVLVLNGIILTVLAATALPETSVPTKNNTADCIPVSAQLSRILFSIPSIGLLMTLTLLTSNIFSMLSNVATILQGKFGIGVVASSLLIGIIPSANIVACGVVDFIAKRLPPLSVIRSAMACQGVPCAMLLGTAYWTGIANTGSLPHAMSVFWCMIFANGLCFPGLNTLYLEPFSDMAGFASGLNGLCQSLLGAWIPALATAATVFGDLLGLQVFLGSVIFVSSCIFWASFGAFPPVWIDQSQTTAASKEVD